MVKNMDSKNENGGMYDEHLRFAQDAAREEMEKYPHLIAWEARLIAKAPARNPDYSYSHLEAFVNKHRTQGID